MCTVYGRSHRKVNDQVSHWLWNNECLPFDSNRFIGQNDYWASVLHFNLALTSCNYDLKSLNLFVTAIWNNKPLESDWRHSIVPRSRRYFFIYFSMVQCILHIPYRKGSTWQPFVTINRWSQIGDITLFQGQGYTSLFTFLWWEAFIPKFYVYFRVVRKNVQPGNLPWQEKINVAEIYCKNLKISISNGSHGMKFQWKWFIS